MKNCLFIITCIVFSNALTAGSLPGSNASSDVPPNFIIIFTDDQGYNDLGCFNAENIKTPNIDQMAAEGMKFTSFYSTSSICSPSRASIMTGTYPRRNGFIGKAFWPKGSQYDSRQGLHPDEITVAEQLKQKGYATACIGKWHLGDYDIFMPTNQGFDLFYGLAYSNDQDSESRFEPPLPLYRNLEIVEQPVDNNLLTQKITEEALQFIDDEKDGPFFLYLAHPMPHDPPGASPEFLGNSDGGIYGDAVEEIDWSTGKIIQKLRELGLDQDTYVVFTSDNGPWLDVTKEHGSAVPLSGGKFDVTEGGLRMPCVMWAPGVIPEGTVCDEVASTMDFFVTFSQIAGVEVPSDRVIDGQNILPLMTGEEGAVSPYEYFLYHGARHIVGELASAIRFGKWKYHYGSEATQDLYDLSVDIGESNNLANDSLA